MVPCVAHRCKQHTATPSRNVLSVLSLDCLLPFAHAGVVKVNMHLQVAGDTERKRKGSLLWRSFWAAHQRFFRYMCMAAKVNAYMGPLFGLLGHGIPVHRHLLHVLAALSSVRC